MFYRDAADATEAQAVTRGGRPGPVEWGLIAVALLYAAALLLGPLVAVLYGALAEGAREFIAQVTSPAAVSALKMTLELGVAATAINLVLGVCIGWVLVRHEFPGRQLVNAIVDLPFVVSPVVAGLMLILLFGRGGFLTPFADALGLKVVFALPGMLLATAFVSLPFVVREVMPVLAQLGVEQENAAYTMGATPWQAFRHVTLPAIRWGIYYGLSLTFARALGEFGAILVVGGGVSGLTETSTLFIFRSLDDRNYVAAYAMATVLAGISFVLLFAMEYLRKRGHRD
jgi:sulfate/thiosulfate transport system permease protein